MRAQVLHASLAAVTAAAGVALVAAGAWSLYHHQPSTVRLAVLVRQVALIAAILAAVAGAAAYLGGARPHHPLHYLYAFFAIVAVPLAVSMTARHPRRGGLYHVGAGLLLLLMCFRLATTG